MSRREAPYALFYASAYLPVAVSLTFLPLWLRSKGLSDAEIGVLMALGSLARLVANPIAGRIADRSGRRKAVLLVICALSFAISFFYTRVDTVADAFVVFLSVTLFSVTILPVGDSITVQGMKAGTVEYGRVRRWGSIAFIAMALATGAAIDAYALDVFSWFLFGAYGAIVICALVLPAGDAPGKAGEERARGGPIDWPAFLLLAGSAAIVQATHGPFNTYATLHWTDSGVAPGSIGFLWSLGIASEVLAFSALAWTSRWLTPGGAIVLGAAAAAVRWFLLAAAPGLATAVAVQALQGASLAATQTGAMRYIATTFPAQSAATITSLYAMLAMGLFQSVFVGAAAGLYASGGERVFAATGAAALAGLVVGVAILRREAAPRTA